MAFSNSSRPGLPGLRRAAAMPEPTTPATRNSVPMASAQALRARSMSAAGTAPRSRRRRPPGQVTELLAQRRQRLRADPVVRPVAEPLGLDQSGVPQDAEVMAHQGLRGAQFLDQVADAELLTGEKLGDPPPERFAERPQAPEDGLI